MKIIDEIIEHKKSINSYQLMFIENSSKVFEKININLLDKKTFIRYNENAKIIEISLRHISNIEIELLFLIHEDMIEIQCSEFTFYLDSMPHSALFDNKSNDFYRDVNKFITSLLKGEYKIIENFHKGKLISRELVWLDSFYNEAINYCVIFRFLYKKRF